MMLRRLVTGLACFASSASLGAAPLREPARPGILNSESARRMAPAELERQILAAVGARFTLVDVERNGFQFAVRLRLPPVADGQVCAASQIDMRFIPEPALAPKGAAPGAVHVSRLPMVAHSVGARQVYRLGPPSLRGWTAAIGPDPCEAVDPRLNFVAAPSARDAAVILAALGRMLEAVRRGRPSFQVHCGGEEETACLGRLARLDPDKVTSVRRGCGAERFSQTTADECFGVSFRPFDQSQDGFSDFSLSLEMRRTGSGSSPSIERVSLNNHRVAI